MYGWSAAARAALWAWWLFVVALIVVAFSLAAGCERDLVRGHAEPAALDAELVEQTHSEAGAVTSTCPAAVVCIAACPRLQDAGSVDCRLACEVGMELAERIFAETVLTCAEAVCIVELGAWSHLLELEAPCFREAIAVVDFQQRSGPGQCRAAWLDCHPSGVQ